MIFYPNLFRGWLTKVLMIESEWELYILICDGQKRCTDLASDTCETNTYLHLPCSALKGTTTHWWLLQTDYVMEALPKRNIFSSPYASIRRYKGKYDHFYFKTIAELLYWNKENHPNMNQPLDLLHRKFLKSLTIQMYV